MAGLLSGASFEDRVETLFRAPLGERMALSPDGQRVAYTLQAGGSLSLVMIDVEHGGAKRTVKLDPDRDEAPTAEATPTALRFLRWASAGRLVFAPSERVVPLPPLTDKTGRTVPNPDGPTIVSPIMVVDSDGKQRGALVDAKDFMETPAEARRTLGDLLRTPKQLAAARNEPVHWRMPHLDILGFLPGGKDQLVVQTHGAYSIPTQHLVDIRSGSVREFGGDWPTPPGEPQVFDWHRLKVVGERKDAARPATTWRDDELGRVQRELETKFPRRAIEILDWSETRARVLFRVTGGSDTGRVFVLQRTEDLVLEIMRCTPWLTAAKLNDTRFFEFTAPDGAQQSGYLTWPAKPRVTPPPLLVVFPAGFPGGAHPAFDPEAQVFADMGFVVARLNHRCVAGVKAEDLTALRAAVDRVSVDDVRAAVDGIASRYPERAFDRRRVAALGRGFGGYLAVRALQLQPGMFRCAIAIDAPMDLRAWLQSTAAAGAAPAKAGRDIPAALIEHAQTDWKKLSVLEQAEALTHPLLLMVEPGRSAAVDASTESLRAQLQALGRAPDHVGLEPGFAAARAAARANAYRKAEEFLNVHLLGYGVKVGPAKEVE
ncbi:MAG TPA: prolyl oligopeptidase family serine peptidase [Opitutaceae bacterium]|nr:prolyl oligopeptidase family serine peptidase [Opitutaceae bacterium]